MNDKIPNDTFDYFDKLNIMCIDHSIPVIGVCSEGSCPEKKLLCMKCIDENSNNNKFKSNSSINNNKTCLNNLMNVEIDNDNNNDNNNNNNYHEIITLGNLFKKFFNELLIDDTSNSNYNNNNNNKEKINLQEFNSLMDTIKDIDKKELLKSLESYNTILTKNIDKFTEKLTSSLESEIEQLNTSYLNQIESLEKNFSQFKEEYNKKENLMSLIKNIPSWFIDLNKKPKSLFYLNKDKSNNSNISFDNYMELINMFKDFNDVDKFKSLSNIMQEKLYYVKLSISNKIKDMYDEKIDTLINKVDDNLNELLSFISPTKEEAVSCCNSLDNNFMNSKFSSNPNNLVFVKNICENSHKTNSIDGVFSVFKSFDNQYIAAWGSTSFSIICYDLETNKIITTNGSAHKSTIFSCRYYADSKSKTDYIITSSYDKSVKLWNFTTGMNLVVNIDKAHQKVLIYSVSVLISYTETCNLVDSKNKEADNSRFIITSCAEDTLKLWSFDNTKLTKSNNKFISNFGKSDETCYFVSTWYDVRLKKNYIINGNSKDVKVYNFKDLTLFKSYSGTPISWHMSAHIIERNYIVTLIESDGLGNIRLWNFYEGILITQVSTPSLNLRGICIWNDDYVIACSSDYQLKVLSISNAALTKSLIGHNLTACSANKISLPSLGECLVSHSVDGKLKLWKIEDNKNNLY